MIPPRSFYKSYAIAGKIARIAGYHLNRPVFVVGSGRCGSSLLMRILKSHRQLKAFPREANSLWHPNSYPYSHRRIDTPIFHSDPERFTQVSLQHWPANHGEKLRDVFTGIHLFRIKPQFLIIKSAMISFMIPTIDALFPDARFIHIYRNGPSVVQSFVIKEWDKYSKQFTDENAFRLHTAHYWNQTIEEIRRLRMNPKFKDKRVFQDISYEDLCNRPAEILTNIALFLGVKPEGYDFDRKTIVSTNYKVGDVETDDNWKELLAIMSSGMRILGYP